MLGIRYWVLIFCLGVFILSWLWGLRGLKTYQLVPDLGLGGGRGGLLSDCVYNEWLFVSDFLGNACVWNYGVSWE